MLPTILEQLNWTEIVMTLLLTVGGAVAVWYRKKLSEWGVFWRDVMDGLRSIPSLNADVRGIRYFVSPNGGGSLMDSARRTETAVQQLTEQVDLVVQTMWAENDSDDEVGRFHTNAAGENTYVNQIFARWLGVGKVELLGWNYINFIHPDDAEQVRLQWSRCRLEHRQYRNTHRMVSSDGEVIQVSMVAMPIPEGPMVKRWIGSVRRIDK